MLKKLSLIAIILILGCSITACTVFTPIDPKPTTSNTDPIDDAINIAGPGPTNNTKVDFLNGNLWEDMQNNLQIPDYSYRPEVQKQIYWFQMHQTYLNAIIKQASHYIYYVFQQTKERSLPAELALLPIIESSYNPFKFSNVGANGLWQIMPGTASGLGLKINWWYDGRRDLIASTDAALSHLAYLSDFFNNNWVLAIAAYNCGEGTIEKKIAYNKKHHLQTDFWSLKSPQQTQAYVPKLLALAAIIRDPDSYKIKLFPIDNSPCLEIVDIGSQIDIAQAAKLAGVSQETLRKLNPGFRRWATDPNGPHKLLLPADKVQQFRENLTTLPKNKRVTWQQHLVKSNESLLSIAKKYQVKVWVIKKFNNLKSNIIQPEQRLIIPIAPLNSKVRPPAKEHAIIAEEFLPGPTQVYVNVKKGDTLWSIGQKYGVKTRELRFWNNLGKTTNTLPPNKRLLVWAPTSHSQRRKAYYRHYQYIVKPGDSLYVIAKLYGVKATTIAHANHIRKNIIHAGQKLTIPAGTFRTFYTIKSGDKLIKIAHRYNVKATDLKKWNNLKTGQLLHAGQKLYIYPL